MVVSISSAESFLFRENLLIGWLTVLQTDKISAAEQNLNLKNSDVLLQASYFFMFIYRLKIKTNCGLLVSYLRNILMINIILNYVYSR